MATICPEEIDVFSIPHSRMKELVYKYLDMLPSTNFSDAVHMTTLLENLLNTFREFKAHEQIENKYIMTKLKAKLKKLSIDNTAVCNCHSDNRLCDMLSLLRDGYKTTEETAADRINYGLQLQRALEDFTEKFLPHMEEEEEVFQPLLIKYFTFDELRKIKMKVLKQHFLRSLHEATEKFVSDEFIWEFSSDESSSEEEYKVTRLKKDFELKLSFSEKSILLADMKNVSSTGVQNLPDEVILKIFSYLSPKDVCRCACTSSHWSDLAFDGSLWTVIRPVQWARGNWNNDTESSDSEDEEDIIEQLINPVTVDEDADFDESGDGDLTQNFHKKQIKCESELLLKMVKNLLPRVGKFVKKCYLAHTCSLTDNLLYKLLQLCPSLEYLDVTQSRISDSAFKGLGRNVCGYRLKYIDLSGCINVSDLTLQRLARTQKLPICRKTGKICLRNDCGSNMKTVCYRRSCPYSGKTLVSKCYLEYSDNENSCLKSKQSELADGDSSITGQYFPTQIQNLCNTVINKNCYGETFEMNSPDHTVVTTEKSWNVSQFEKCSHEKSADTKCSDFEEGLNHISLSGCYLISDDGLRYLADVGMPSLSYLDLSGCLSITADGLVDIVSRCPQLPLNNLFYCDNILHVPFDDLASGCRNLQCRSRICCRTGE